MNVQALIARATRVDTQEEREAWDQYLCAVILDGDELDKHPDQRAEKMLAERRKRFDSELPDHEERRAWDGYFCAVLVLGTGIKMAAKQADERLADRRMRFRVI